MESQKEQIITKIAFDLMRKGFDSDQINVIKQSIYLAAAKYDFVPQETGLACVDPLEQNCVMMFYIAKKVEGCSDKTLKTIYIWATQDRKAHQGYWSTWSGYNKGRKGKNHGKS